MATVATTSTGTVTGTEADEARALHTVAEMLTDYPDAVHHTLRKAVANVLRAGAIELNAGHAVPLEIRRAIRRLAYDIQRHMREVGGDTASR